MATIIPFSFDEIYSDIVTKLGNDSVYEGSNLSQIVTAMSYLISSLNINTAANINETFLPLARKEKNVLETARLQSYEGFKKKSYTYTITLTLTETILEANKYVINKYDNFEIQGKNFLYVGETPINVFGASGHTIQLIVKEGTLYSYNNDEALYQTIGTTISKTNGEVIPRGFIDIPYENVENDGIELFLTYTKDGISYTDQKWIQSNTMLVDKDFIFNKKFIRKDDLTFKTPRCYFKVGGIGNDLPSSTIVKANVIQSLGVDGGIQQNDDGTWPEATFKIELLNIDITYELLTSGANAESTESIRTNAQLFNNTANRVISPIDYISFCNSQATIRGSKIWGGDEETPYRPGEVWFSLLPTTYLRTFSRSDDGRTFTLDNTLNTAANANWFLENAEISNPEDPNNPGLWDILEYYKVPTLRYINRSPLFLDCDFGIKILKYNTIKSEVEINLAVFDVIDNYFKENGSFDLMGEDVSFMEQFNAEFFITNLIKRINEQTTDASGFTIDLLNSFTIYDHNLCLETYDNSYGTGVVLNDAHFDVSLTLEAPFEGIFDNDGYLIIDRLPNINAQDVTFSSTGTAPYDITGDITLDTTDVIDVDYTELSYITMPIIFTEDSIEYVIGKYEIFKGFKDSIKITFFVKEDISGHQSTATGVYAASPLVHTMFTVPKKMNIEFYSPNFRVLKNTVPRLNSVEFYA